MIELLFFLFQGEATSKKPELCVECHEGAAKQHRESVHFKEQIFCTACHGGNADILDEKKAHEPDFRKEPYQSCFECHQEVKTFFEKGPHGEALRRSKMKGCVDCHSDHRVLEASIEILRQGCARCHAANEALLQRATLAANRFSQFPSKTWAVRQHTLNFEEIIQDLSDREAEKEKRKWWLLPVWVLAALNILFLSLKLRRSQKKEGG